MMYGKKYNKYRLEELGITVLEDEDDIWNPSLIIESSDGSFMRYNIHNNVVIDESLVDIAIDRFIVQLRREKIQKINEQFNRTC